MNTNLHYLERYNKFINHYRINPRGGFCELHHVIPKCMGGTDSAENLLLVPSRIHFILHYLLYKSYPDNRKLAHAFAMMGVSNKHQERKVSSRIYESSKFARSSALRGVSRPEWVKEKLRKPKKNKENYKYSKSKTHSENISKSLSGKSKTEQHIKNMVESQRHYHQKRTEGMMKKIQMFRKLFLQDNITRQQFAIKYNLSLSTMKRYLKGL